jgi:hypothetical protein
MVEVSLQHIIGTVALIGLVVSVCLFYSVYTASIQTDSQERQLQQISGTVALNAEEMINLVKFSKYNGEACMAKVIDLPNAVGGQPYNVQLVSDPQKGIYIHTFLAAQPTIYADSSIPLNSGGTPIVADTSETPQPITAGADNTKITCQSIVYGKDSTVIWAKLVWGETTEPNQITLGIGWVSGQQ